MLDLNSLTDLESFFADNPAESVGLEYKSSKILAKGEIGPICKGVSAFANSAGGTFVIGIDAKDGRTTLDDGWQGQSKLDWIYRAINSGTFPAVETAVVKEIQGERGKYYVISVDVSKEAPHQGQDNRYYKRRGSHSDPMEHYEIEDVRNRPKGKGSPLEIRVETH
ncbi:ATP-binding protein [Agrobacterium sp.]|uniref:AlbA family DNA-binding domain-containing protein n=1 Tax=Agrobacterium sp. TaxID=361 RepID=UPI00289E0B79|nr:ATP-binding protein [Agrobacterium sp.]